MAHLRIIAVESTNQGIVEQNQFLARVVTSPTYPGFCRQFAILHITNPEPSPGRLGPGQACRLTGWQLVLFSRIFGAQLDLVHRTLKQRYRNSGPSNREAVSDPRAHNPERPAHRE